MSIDHQIQLVTETKGPLRILKGLLADYVILLIRLYGLAGKATKFPFLGPLIKAIGEWYCKKVHGAKVICQEEADNILEKAKQIVLFPCACRGGLKNCDRSTLSCIILFDSDLFLKAGSEQAKYISKEEAKKVMVDCEKEGLFRNISWCAEHLHNISWCAEHLHNISWCAEHLYAICNCCPCCPPDVCIAFRGQMRYNIHNALSKGQMVASVNSHLCNGCGHCFEACSFGAVKKIKVAGPVETRVTIDPSGYFGCGLCHQVCPTKAVSLIIRPHNSLIEKGVY